MGSKGAIIFDQACRIGPEGIEMERPDLLTAKCWVKVKNPMNPAMLRIENGTF